MAKHSATRYVCGHCGFESPKWAGKCPGCGEWSTFEEKASVSVAGRAGGKRDKGVKPYKHVKGSGSIIRKALQQLEENNLVETVSGKGRKITSKGQKLLDNAAFEISKEIGKFI